MRAFLPFPAWRRLARGALLLLLAAGCRRPAAGGPVTVYQAEGSVDVRIVNHNQLDVVIYVVHDGVRDRLGTVTGTSTASLVLPMRLLGAGREYRLLADPIGSRRTVQTELLRATNGDVVTWSLETQLERSTVVVH